MSIPEGDRKISKSLGSEWRDTTETEKLPSHGIEDHVDGNSRALLEKEWSNRIKVWQAEIPNCIPIEECTSLREIRTCAFVIQHPFAGMSLWNVMQCFYALDRLVCYTSKGFPDKISEWETMPPFEYLEAPRVERRWRTSLQSLRNEIHEENGQDISEPGKDSMLLAVTKIEGTRRGSKAGLEENKNGSKREALLRRIDGIFSGITKLENAQSKLRHNFKENLDGVPLVDLMLESIDKAARTRFSMIDTSLTMDDNLEDGNCFDHKAEARKSKDRTYESGPIKSKLPTTEERRVFKPLTRTRSIDVVKHHLVIAWVSTRRGDATLSAIFILFVLIVCLYRIQRYLVVRLEY